MTDILPFDDLDQSLPIETIDELMFVDELVSDALSKRDPDIVFNYMVNIYKQFQVRGLALTKTCYLMNKHWEEFKIGDNFLDTASAYLGIHRHTVERYIRIWELFLVAPEKFVQDLQQKGVRTLAPVANAIAQGYEIEDKIWDKIVDAPDYASVSKIINEEVKEVEGRVNRLTILMDRSGSLWAISGDERLFIGSLEVEDDNEIVKKAIERLTKNAGVLRQ